VRRHPAFAKLVLVSTGEQAFRGILVRTHGRYVVLADAFVIEQGSAPVRADGEIILHRDKVQYIQVLTGQV
jgi:hypothetical protein